jgi:hypothetical protein
MTLGTDKPDLREKQCEVDSNCSEDEHDIGPTVLKKPGSSNSVIIDFSRIN